MSKKPTTPKEKAGTVTALENPKVVPITQKKEEPKMAEPQVNKIPQAYVNKAALSIDVGEKAVLAWKATKDLDDKISDLVDQNTRQKGNALKMLTLAFVKAAQNDKNIILENVYLDKSEKLRDLRQRCEVAVGIKVVKRGEDGVDRYEYANWAKEVFPQPKEDKTQPGFQAKDTFRANFAAAMTKCIKAADALILKNIRVEEDKATGTLMLEGKAVKEHFDVDKVALNEKREVVENGKVVKIAKIPSFTELARISAEARNKKIPTRAETAKAINPLNEKDVISAVQSITMALSKLKSFGDELATAIEALAEACDDAINRNGQDDEEENGAA